jgi:hypothetical protein
MSDIGMKSVAREPVSPAGPDIPAQGASLPGSPETALIQNKLMGVLTQKAKELDGGTTLIRYVGGNQVTVENKGSRDTGTNTVDSQKTWMRAAVIMPDGTALFLDRSDGVVKEVGRVKPVAGPDGRVKEVLREQGANLDFFTPKELAVLVSSISAVNKETPRLPEEANRDYQKEIGRLMESADTKLVSNDFPNKLWARKVNLQDGGKATLFKSEVGVGDNSYTEHYIAVETKKGEKYQIQITTTGRFAEMSQEHEFTGKDGQPDSVNIPVLPPSRGVKLLNDIIREANAK